MLEVETIHAIRPTHGEALRDDAHDIHVGRQTFWLSPLRNAWTGTTSNCSTNLMHTQTVPEVQYYSLSRARATSFRVEG